MIEQIVNREEQYTVTVVDIEEITETTVIPAVTHEEVIIDAPESIDDVTGEVIPAITHTEVIIDEPERVLEPSPAMTHEETRTRIVPVMQSVTVDMTAEEEAELLANQPDTTAQQIESLKAQLAATDYKAIKYAEGLITEEDYEETRAQRQAWRDEINRLEAS